MRQGYSAFQSYVDLHSGVAANSNIVTVRNLTNFPTGCNQLSINFNGFNNATSPAWTQNSVYAQVQSEPDRTLALYSDSACTTALNVDAAMPEGNYLQIQASSSDRSPAIGWDS